MKNKTLFIIVIFLFVIKIVAINFTDFDLFGDEAQYWLWSKNLDFGYFSKPPFLSWFIGAYTEIFGDEFVKLKLIPVLVYLFTSWALNNICKNIGFDKKNALTCS